MNTNISSIYSLSGFLILKCNDDVIFRRPYMVGYSTYEEQQMRINARELNTFRVVY